MMERRSRGKSGVRRLAGGGMGKNVIERAAEKMKEGKGRLCGQKKSGKKGAWARSM